MREERELERHIRVVDSIKESHSKEDLPNISYAKISSYLSSVLNFNSKHLSQSKFNDVVNYLIHNGGNYNSLEFKSMLYNILEDNYKDIDNNKIVKKINEVISSNRIKYLLTEISLKNVKLYEFERINNKNNHELIMKEIENAYDIKDLPKVSVSDLNRKILKAFNSNDFVNNIGIDCVREVIKCYLKNYSFSNIKGVIREFVGGYNLSKDSKELMCEQIIGALMNDETIDYLKEELLSKEARKLKIYRMDHENTMLLIKDARRISELPPNLSVSTLTSYLNGNTTIYTNDDRVKSEDLKELTNLLLEGHKWQDDVITSEINEIADRLYPEKEFASYMLHDKLSKLPKTYYLVEEINYALQKTKEFIRKGKNNVNIYMLPNNNGPLEGGRFYNCYINRVDNLNLEDLLPLNLDEIVPKGMDIDSVEWYIQEYYDDTFKKAGGIILNKDESIGNVNVFKPNDGKYGVSKEEVEKLNKIDDLDKAIVEKESILKELEEEISINTSKRCDIEERIENSINEYEKKVLLLQKELLSSIEEIKQELNDKTLTRKKDK